MIEFFRGKYAIAGEVLAAAEQALQRVEHIRYDAQRAVKYRVLSAFLEEGLAESDLAGSTGYGYDDAARARYESMLARIFGTEAALARISLASGTHAIVATLRACVPPGKTLLCITGSPYDTLLGAIAVERYNLVQQGLRYRNVPLCADGQINLEAVEAALSCEVAAVFIQRSRGYAARRSFSIDACAKAIDFVRAHCPSALILVDNAYGELVEEREPTHVGADAVMGSLIKNLGGAIAPTGGYVAGTHAIVERVAAQLYAPGLGSALGPTLGLGRLFLQGLFQAPLIVEQTLRGLDFCAALFHQLRFAVQPAAGERRTDIIQAISLGEANLVRAFARGLQRAMPVNSGFRPEPGRVPGYRDPVIMSGGAFISGGTLELSCDAPLREPYDVYLQGGVITEQAVVGSMLAADAVMQIVRASAAGGGRLAQKGEKLQKELRTVDNQENSVQRRQFDRARVDLPVSYSLVGEPGSAQARVVDLSGGGARIATDADLAPGAQLELTFRLRETDAQVVARGRIIMSFFEGSEQRYLHGVAFTQIAPADQEAIVQYIHEVQFPKLYGITRP